MNFYAYLKHCIAVGVRQRSLQAAEIRLVKVVKVKVVNAHFAELDVVLLVAAGDGRLVGRVLVHRHVQVHRVPVLTERKECRTIQMDFVHNLGYKIFNGTSNVICI